MTLRSYLKPDQIGRKSNIYMKCGNPAGSILEEGMLTQELFVNLLKMIPIHEKASSSILEELPAFLAVFVSIRLACYMAQFSHPIPYPLSLEIVRMRT